MAEDDYDDFGDDDEDDEDWLDCGLSIDGQCSKAGSEECDWECPYSHGERYAGSEAWHKEHNACVPVSGCACPECNEARAAHPHFAARPAR